MSGIGDLSTVFGAAGGPVKAEVYTDSQSNVSPTMQQVTDRSVASGGDRTVVSTMAGALSQALGTSDVRMDKVAQLQAVIANGSYNVSSSDIADKLLQSMMGRS